MGWLWYSGDDDAYVGLPSKVRLALQREAPSARQDSVPALSVPRTANIAPRALDHYRAQAGFISGDENPSVTPEKSLYQDGRYANLWASYSPPDPVETQTPHHDTLGMVVDAAKHRQAEVTRAALENCIFYQLAERECLGNGSFKDRITMCGKQAKASNRCYTMQSRFLKALGYAATDTTDKANDDIQMHAEQLYNQMLDREKAIEDAKQSGAPEPRFQPLIKQDATLRSEALAFIGQDKMRDFDAKLSGMSQSDKDLEMSLLIADIRATREHSQKVNQVWDNERIERAARRAKGQETFGDTLKRLWGWPT